METPPQVCFVVAVFNDESGIEACVNSILNQDYPQECISVLLADGGSSRATRATLENLCKHDARVELIDNPRRIQSAAYNIGMARAPGEFVALASAHSVHPSDYVCRCVSLAQSTRADNVGGLQDALPAVDSPMASAIAVAHSSPIAIGNAYYRHATSERDVDTVFPGFFRRSTLLRVGGFDESLPVHEDYELNARIRAAGGRVRFSPDIHVSYHPRATLRGLAVQYFRYGRGKTTVARSRPSVVRAYHLAPPALVSAVALGTLAAGTQRGRRLLGVSLPAYAAFLALAGTRTGRDQPPDVRVRIPMAIATMQISWGCGFWVGMLSPQRRRR